MKIGLIATLLAFAFSAMAHPGNGIMAINSQTVITGDAAGNGIWKFEVGKSPKLLYDNMHCHWVTKGLDGKLYAEVSGARGNDWRASHYEIFANGQKARVIATGLPLHWSHFLVDARGQRIVHHEDRLVILRGNEVMAKWSLVGGNSSPLPAKQRSVGALAWGPSGQIFAASAKRVFCADKSVSVFGVLEGKPTFEMYAAPGNQRRVWGMATDAKGAVYAADASMGQVIKMAAGQPPTVVSKAQDGWIATGVATLGQDLFLLESKVVGNRNYGPRVRKIGKDGKATLMGEVKR